MISQFLNFLISVQNWIKDLIWKQVNLDYPNMPNAKVCAINHLCNFASFFNSKTWLNFSPFIFLMRFLLWLKVHFGFYSSYNNTILRPAIMNAVRKARKLHGNGDIIVTGHSMGGAIASFCALDLAVSDPPNT